MAAGSWSTPPQDALYPVWSETGTSLQGFRAVGAPFYDGNVTYISTKNCGNGKAGTIVQSVNGVLYKKCDHTDAYHTQTAFYNPLPTSVCQEVCTEERQMGSLHRAVGKVPMLTASSVAW